jgi:hypothetical protein
MALKVTQFANAHHASLLLVTSFVCWGVSSTCPVLPILPLLPQINSSVCTAGQPHPGGSEPENPDLQFQDFSATLLILWLLVRMVALVMPVVAIRTLMRRVNGGPHAEQNQADRVVEIELETEVGSRLAAARMEEGQAGAAARAGAAETGGRLPPAAVLPPAAAPLPVLVASGAASPEN